MRPLLLLGLVGCAARSESPDSFEAMHASVQQSTIDVRTAQHEADLLLIEVRDQHNVAARPPRFTPIAYELERAP